MKWIRRKIDGIWNYSLRVNENLVFQIEPDYGDIYVIWIAAEGWFHPLMHIKYLSAAKGLCNEIAAIIEKYKE